MSSKYVIIMAFVLSVALVACDESAEPVETAVPASDGILAGVEGMEHLFGPEITPPDLVGKVVLFEYWAYNCPPCRASFPHLVELQETYGPTGKFTVLASHVGDNRTKAVEFCQSVDVNFPVYQQLDLPGEPGDGFIPYMVLIDHEGNVVKRGRGSEFYDLVPGLVDAAGR
jgi:thiol-disulfide isomerase/thioredoxin